MNLASLAPSDDVRRRRLAPPRAPRSHGEIARTMTLPDGPSAGERWDPETEPVQSVWVRRLDDSRFRRRTLVTPSQRGKSLMGIALPMVRTLTELCQNVSYIMPNLDKLNQSWEGKVRPLLVGCGYGAWLPAIGPGSRGGRPASLILRNPDTGARAGLLYFQAASGGGKETSLASVTAKRASADEGDDFESAAHLQLGQKRTESFGEEGEFDAVSTVNDRKGRDGHPILQSYERGTKTRLWYQCPHCAFKGETAGFQVLTFANLIYDSASGPTAKASARYRCAYCAVMWTDGDRKRALAVFREVHDGQKIDAAGNVTGDEPVTDHYSLMANDLEFNMSVLGRLAEDEWAAKEAVNDRSDHSLMRQFYHKRRCEDYTADIDELQMGTELQWSDLLEKSQRCKMYGPVIATKDKTEADGQTYSRHIADPPADVMCAAGGVDLQNNRVYWTLVAFQADMTSYDFAWGYEYARSDHKPWSEGELHALLDRTDAVMRRACKGVPCEMIGLDVADGEHLPPASSWLRGRRGQWVPIRGNVSAMRPEPNDIDGMCYWRSGAWLLNTDNLREIIHAAYRRPNGTIGAAHLPYGLSNNASDAAYLRHLVAERRVFDPKTKKEKIQHGPGRWDWQDARRIAEAMGRLSLRRMAAPKRELRLPGRQPDWVGGGSDWDLGTSGGFDL